MYNDQESRILVVDDVVDNLDLIRDLLDDEPYDVVTARSATEAIHLTEAVHFDAAILDVQMPEIDGFELCRTLRESPRTRRLPIIFLTAKRNSPDDRVAGLELGACDYISKPFDALEFRARVRAVLRTAQEHKDELHECHTVNRRLREF